MASTTPVICLPVKLDAYSLNPSACGAFPSATLAPLAQPNFTFLRLDSQLMEPDVLQFHDLHNASPAALNPRVTNLVTGESRVERQGVYLHWMLPRTYRSGAAKPAANGDDDINKPEFRLAPDRWLILRRLHPGFQPSDVISSKRMKWIEAWVVESNRVRRITEFGQDIDIELECSPFVIGGGSETLDSQAEIFIGHKTHLSDWNESRAATGDDPNFVDLNVTGPANPLFADYTPHNANVFSILDNFAYKDSKGDVAYLTSATASYYVLGWHSRVDDDNLHNLGGKTLGAALRESLLELMDPEDINLNLFPPSRALCHGAIYGVKYQPDMAGINVPADIAGQKLADKDSHPVTVGTTPLDAILAYIRSHSGSTTPVEDDILHLETLLLKQEDDIDSQQEALDMLTANNFKPTQESGVHWHFSVTASNDSPNGVAPSKKTQQVFVPSADQQRDLATLNAFQVAYDSAARELKSAQWELFAKWWTFCADGTLLTRKSESELAAETMAQVQLIGSLQDKMTALKNMIQASPLLQTPVLVEKGSQAVFSKQDDPTILVPGVENPWPVDWLKNLRVRLHSQIGARALPTTLPVEWGDLGTAIKTDIPKKLPSDIQSTASSLLAEFFNLHPKDSTDDTWVEQPSALLPVYHDHVEDISDVKEGPASDGTSRDQWNTTQPYFPLFLEYELRYYHLDKDYWEFGIPDIDPMPGNPHRARYGLRDGANVDGETEDERVIRGRILVLPQPGFLLSTNIQRLFAATNAKDLPPDLQSEDERAKFLSEVQQLAYLSSPLAGFIDHLITILNGTHIKPTIRKPGQSLEALEEAATAGKGAGFCVDNITFMGIETNKTPYADYIGFPNEKIDPLKPVTHGQFKFTRLDIIDKFGQAISAIDPKPARLIPPLYPALSEYFHPQHLSSDRGQAKTVGQDPYGHCQFAQFPPTINQEARLNANFLHLDPDPAIGWRPCTEWEDPVWGFLVVNYAEYALQVFLPDGTFYREVRKGGPSGVTETPSWKPFAPPDGDSNGKQTEQFPQLDRLITKLKNEEGYLDELIQTINASLGSIPHTPNQYAEFLNAIVGRPLALANVGISLELAAPPVKSQSSVSTYDQSDWPTLLKYSFALKLGDKDRVYDGLVGYFSPPKPDTMLGEQTLSGELDLDTLLTYFPSGGNSTKKITNDDYPRVSPYHLSVSDLEFTMDATTQNEVVARDLAKAHAARMTMVGALFDPFSKVHVYSGILPITSLQLPPWSLQKAMERMTAFFHMGPLLITDARGLKFDPTKALTPDYNLAALQEVAEDDKEGQEGSEPGVQTSAPVGIALPAIKSAEWNWLAPFIVTEAAGDDRDTKWNPFVISHLDNKPKYEKGPYTAIEGYLQLKHPITAPDTI
ncbi:hypothetical protein F5Y10DRAFT_290228 [Nemania abortiva]|nr:hypothetical protein F5Y10DRAFT_290228 [Nemania abortiva]